MIHHHTSCIFRPSQVSCAHMTCHCIHPLMLYYRRLLSVAAGVFLSVSSPIANGCHLLVSFLGTCQFALSICIINMCEILQSEEVWWFIIGPCNNLFGWPLYCLILIWKQTSFILFSFLYKCFQCTQIMPQCKVSFKF